MVAPRDVLNPRIRLARLALAIDAEDGDNTTEGLIAKGDGVGSSGCYSSRRKSFLDWASGREDKAAIGREHPVAGKGIDIDYLDALSQ